MLFKPSKFSRGSSAQPFQSGGGGVSDGEVSILRSPTTAVPVPGSDVDEEGNTKDFDTKNDGGELTGFADNRTFLQKLGDALQGKASPVGMLNAQLALGRDTTAQQLKNQLALSQQQGDIELRNKTSTIGQEGDIRKQLLQADHEHAVKMASIQNSAASDLSKQKAMQELEADKLKSDLAFAATNNISHRDLEALRQPALTRATSALNVADLANQVEAARKGIYLKDLNTPNSPSAQAALRGQNAPDALAVGNAMKANTLLANPNEALFTQAFPGVGWKTTATFGSVPANKNPITGLDVPGTGSPARQVEDKSDELRGTGKTGKDYRDAWGVDGGVKIPMRPGSPAVPTTAGVVNNPSSLSVLGSVLNPPVLPSQPSGILPNSRGISSRC
ncbi:MAG: hypothetical protein EBU46_17225 [Nitrosomonadaceae bacterium]|nr:hypothetical protein [Nitrosomonadaceae bacterium]